ncbi:Sulfhydryl oxidase [Kluyveromyces marxianus]
MSNNTETGKQVNIGPSGRQIIYDEDGKPFFVTGKLTSEKSGAGAGARAGATTVDMSDQMKDLPSAASNEPANLIPGSKSLTKVDPPDVEELGRSSWTLLHSIAAKYPNRPSDTQKQEMKQFMTIFSHVYPCNWCAKDFEKFIKQNAPKVESKEALGRWLCKAHNEVNRKLKKEEFNCDLWKKRWVDGWE